MTRRNPHLPKVELFAALASGRRKAQLFLLETKTLDESSTLLRFISNSSEMEYGVKKGSDIEEIRMSDLISNAMSPTLAKNLEEKADIRTLQDLLSSDARTVRSALAEEEAYLQEIVLAMIPNRIGASWIAYAEQAQPDRPFV
jgi:hypothetical protein